MMNVISILFCKIITCLVSQMCNKLEEIPLTSLFKFETCVWSGFTSMVCWPDLTILAQNTNHYATNFSILLMAFIVFYRIFQKWLHSVFEFRLKFVAESLRTASDNSRGRFGHCSWVWSQLGIGAWPWRSRVLARRQPRGFLLDVHLQRQRLWCQ